MSGPKRYDYEAHLTHFGVNLGIDQEKLAWYDEVNRIRAETGAGRLVPEEHRPSSVGALAVPERSRRREHP